MDSQVLVELFNMIVPCSNPVTEPIVSRVHGALATLYGDVFDYKGKHLASHDWRPREFNRADDALRSAAIRARTNIHFDWGPDLSTDLLGIPAAQIYSDGGLQGDSGTAAWVAFAVHPRGRVPPES
ncbi:unnamed protein product [Prorocentrum cordatum]|uniref:Uncharacterized protein n=1 Tax=Prorocentrum cordatum TaxID=2364126 RepID=A0ABN9UU12_9DINO|nr:unnamed protein product [Polarella glacialis]